MVDARQEFALKPAQRFLADLIPTLELRIQLKPSVARLPHVFTQGLEHLGRRHRLLQPLQEPPEFAS